MSATRTETETADLMMRHGIVRVSVDQFYCNGWRYSNLGDAVAEAKRGERRQASQTGEPAAPVAPAKSHEDGVLLTKGKN